MNRSAKERARSSLHYGGEGVLIHLSYQGVCGRHGVEDQCVTPGGLMAFRVASEKRFHKRKRNEARCAMSSRTVEWYLKPCENKVTLDRAGE